MLFVFSLCVVSVDARSRFESDVEEPPPHPASGNVMRLAMKNCETFIAISRIDFSSKPSGHCI
jgi:hypothetical protein